LGPEAELRVKPDDFDYAKERHEATLRMNIPETAFEEIADFSAERFLEGLRTLARRHPLQAKKRAIEALKRLSVLLEDL